MPITSIGLQDAPRQAKRYAHKKARLLSSALRRAFQLAQLVLLERGPLFPGDLACTIACITSVALILPHSQPDLHS